MTQIWSILLTALVTMLLLTLEHYWPWKLIHGQELGPITRYVLGVLAIEIPLSVLLMTWADWYALAALWIVTGAGGVAVSGSYIQDRYHQVRLRAEVSEREAKTLRSLDE